MMVAAASDTMLHTRLLSTNDREKLRGWILIHYYCILFTYIRYTIHVFNILPFFSFRHFIPIYIFRDIPTPSIVPSIQHQLHHPLVNLTVVTFTSPHHRASSSSFSCKWFQVVFATLTYDFLFITFHCAKFFFLYFVDKIGMSERMWVDTHIFYTSSYSFFR